MIAQLRRKTFLLSFCALASLAVPAWGVTLGQIDDFEDGTRRNWNGDLTSLVNMSTGGPAGAGDNYFHVSANGTVGPGSRLVTYNTTQWIGNYASAQISTLDMDVTNVGVNPIHLRIAFVDGGAIPTWYASTSPIVLPVGSAWQRVSFSLTSVTRISGSAALSAVLPNIQSLRILSSVDLPVTGGGGARGDAIQADLGLDNITAAGATADADFNNDGKVDGADFLIWQRGLGVGTTNAQGDADGNSVVNATDLAAWKTRFGGSSASSTAAAVPEPTGCLLAVTLLLAVSQRFRR